MKEKKNVLKISFATACLTIALIIIAIMGYLLCIFNNEKNMAKNEASILSSKVLELEEKINKQKGIASNTTKNEQNNINNENKVDQAEVKEKQTVTAIGYKIILYTNNELKLIPNVKEIEQSSQDDFDENDKFNESYDIKISGNVYKMFQANNGTGVDPITFFIMDDGTVQYIQPLETLILRKGKSTITFEVKEKLKNLKNIIDMKTNISDVVIAIDQDGQEIKCWNEWMEEMPE